MKQNTDKTLTVKQNNFVTLGPLSVFCLLQTLLCLSSLSLSKSLHLEHYMHNHIKSFQVSGHTSPFSFQHTDTPTAPVLEPSLIARVLNHTRDIGNTQGVPNQYVVKCCINTVYPFACLWMTKKQRFFSFIFGKLGSAGRFQNWL